MRELRAGWSRRRSLRAFPWVLALRLAVALFALHASGAAHLLSDILLDDDMTCVDELARKAQHGLAPPSCPASQSMAHGQAFAPPTGTDLAIHEAEPEQDLPRRTLSSTTPFIPPRSIDRPPRS